MITHSNLSKMKDKILPTSLQGNSRDSLGEFSNTIHVHHMTCLRLKRLYLNYTQHQLISIDSNTMSASTQML